MDPIIQTELRNSWLIKENIELQQKRRRRYLHFDEILEKISPSIFKKITDPNFVSKHAFFPLIRRFQKNRLYKRDPITRKKKIVNKLRPISYSSHFDALIYSWYSKQIEDLYEMELIKLGISDNVIAYRSLGKSNLTFSKEIFDFIKTRDESVAVALDIKGFYDNLDSKLLKKSWTKILSRKDLPLDHYQVYKSITKFSYVDIEDIRKILNIGKKDHKKLKFFLNINILDDLRKGKKIKINSNNGIPQGTPISCVLSNLYMLDFDLAISNKIAKAGGIYRRYSDDIIVVCQKKDLESIKDSLYQEIEKVKLIIESTKTEIRFFERNGSTLICFDDKLNKSKLQYLGVEFDGVKMSLRHKGYAKFERRMTKLIKKSVVITSKSKIFIPKKKIYEKFTPLGDMNYVVYAKRAAKELGSKNIERPVNSHKLFKKVNQKINKSKKILELNK